MEFHKRMSSRIRPVNIYKISKLFKIFYKYADYDLAGGSIGKYPSHSKII